jgi:hypothetical protein
MAAAVRPRADHFLECDDVGVDGAEHRGDPIGTSPAVEAAAAMNVVGGDAQRRPRAVSHYVMIVAELAVMTADAHSAQRRRRTRRMRGALLVAAIVLSSGCRTIERDPFTLERNVLTVDNRSSQDWKHVEIWLNTYYHVTTDSLPAKTRFQAPLDTFVAGYGQRFDWRRAPIRGVRLTARLAGGKPFELIKQFDAPAGLAGALGGKR